MKFPISEDQQPGKYPTNLILQQIERRGLAVHHALRRAQGRATLSIIAYIWAALLANPMCGGENGRSMSRKNALQTFDPHPIAEQLSHRFGSNAAISREGIKTVLDSVGCDGRRAFSQWKDLFPHWTGRHVEQISQALRRPAERFGVSPRSDNSAKLLFAMQSYYCLLVELTAERFAAASGGELLPESPFAWCKSAKSKPLGRFVERLRDEVAGLEFDSSRDGARDWFKPLYEKIFPRQLRHRLGEYYTPDWLAEHILDQVGYDGDPASRLLDPACGSGTFLMAALRRCGEWRVESAKPQAASHPSSLFSPHSPLLSTPPIVGFDLNPLAVLTARANYLIAVGSLFPDAGRVEPPIYMHDSILDRGESPSGIGQLDFVVGNPPWIAWDNLPEEDRRATKPLWERYGLFSLTGNEARHGGGKKDLSMLMLYATADKYLKTAGRLGMVITQSIFQTIGAGDGFRQFRLGPDGDPLGVLRVDDMTELRPFDAATRTSTIVLGKGTPTRYPVRYVKWKENRKNCVRKRKGWALQYPVALEECAARPVDPSKPTSPWLVERKNASKPLAVSQSDAAYTAHLGANSGGANGVYWIEVLEQRTDGLLVRNLATAGKHQLETVEAVIEPDLVYPLLRWGDVARYRAESHCYILLAQDPATRSGINEKVMRKKYPRTLAYLERFRDMLVTRAAYRRYQQRGPFYSMYNVGSYTVAPIKVVWRRMDRRINAAVVEPPAVSARPTVISPFEKGATAGLPSSAGDISRGNTAGQASSGTRISQNRLSQRTVLGVSARPTVAALCGKTFVPQETCVLVECGSSDEAHYLCATLNSRAINELAAGHGITGGKSFGSPGMLKYLPIECFDPANQQHLELVSLSRKSHAAAS